MIDKSVIFIWKASY